MAGISPKLFPAGDDLRKGLLDGFLGEPFVAENGTGLPQDDRREPLLQLGQFGVGGLGSHGSAGCVCV